MTKSTDVVNSAIPQPVPASIKGKRQRLFVEEYLKDLNARQAALRAGYSFTHAVKACQMLERPDVKKYIEEAMDQRVERIHLDQDAVIYGLEDMIQYNATKILKKSAHDEIEEMRNAPVALKALELLAKHFGMFKDDGSNNKVTVLLKDFTGN